MKRLIAFLLALTMLFALAATGVRVNSLNETYYNTRYIGARRII